MHAMPCALSAALTSWGGHLSCAPVIYMHG
jgi:hypothetical protein